MSLELVFTPSGRLVVVEPTPDSARNEGSPAPEIIDGRLKKVAKAFSTGYDEGLFVLATERFDASLPPSFGYWRDFAAKYLTALCHTPVGVSGSLEPIAPPE